MEHNTNGLEFFNKCCQFEIMFLYKTKQELSIIYTEADIQFWVSRLKTLQCGFLYFESIKQKNTIYILPFP